MRRFGIISYNIYCNFTNYGSTLQSWALNQAIKNTGYTPVLVDYCPDVLSDKSPLHPYNNMWDQDPESKKMVSLTMPAIEKNYLKFEKFYRERFTKTSQKYTSRNFNEIAKEYLDGFVCGSDTIFCIDEFNGFDDGFYANYPEMKGRSVSYAASFGDSHFDESSYLILNDRINNFKAIGLRESNMIPYISSKVTFPVKRTLDPTLLLTAEDYDVITSEQQYTEPYLLLYTRRYDPNIEVYAERIAKERKIKIVEISLRAINSNKGHIMRYDAGVEEFLSLVKYSSFVVTNSFHGLIFAVQYKKPFAVFKRQQADTKISELLCLLGINKSYINSGGEEFCEIDYGSVYKNISIARRSSMDFLRMELGLL